MRSTTTGLTEQDILNTAELLGEKEWQTPLWHRFVGALKSADSGQWSGWEKTLQSIDTVLESALEQHASLRLTSQEVTRETAVSNLLLWEGLAAWQEALELARLAAEEGQPWQDALEEAEQANRLLVSVGVYARRVEGSRPKASIF